MVTHLRIAKILPKPNASKDSAHVIGGNANWYSTYRTGFGSSLQSYEELTTWPRNPIPDYPPYTLEKWKFMFTQKYAHKYL